MIYRPDSVILAPLSGYTDLPFRRACRAHGCHYAFTPLIEAGSIVHSNPRAPALLLRGPDEPWLGLQILGSDPQWLGRAVRMLGGRTFDLIDLNMGCPMPKVTRRGAGAALGLNPELAVACIAAIVANTERPVTAKIRVIDAVDPAPTVHLGRRLAAAGIQALTVHGRQWERIYAGPVAGHVIRAVRDALDIPVIANGGVKDRAAAEELRESSGCSRIMVARGAIGNPWLFAEIGGRQDTPPTAETVCAELQRHVLGMVELYGEDRGLRIARKIISAYLGGRGFPRQCRARVTSIARLTEFRELLAAVIAASPPAERP